MIATPTARHAVTVYRYGYRDGTAAAPPDIAEVVSHMKLRPALAPTAERYAPVQVLNGHGFPADVPGLPAAGLLSGDGWVAWLRRSYVKSVPAKALKAEVAARAEEMEAAGAEVPKSLPDDVRSEMLGRIPAQTQDTLCVWRPDRSELVVLAKGRAADDAAEDARLLFRLASAEGGDRIPLMRRVTVGSVLGEMRPGADVAVSTMASKPLRWLFDAIKHTDAAHVLDDGDDDEEASEPAVLKQGDGEEIHWWWSNRVKVEVEGDPVSLRNDAAKMAARAGEEDAGRLDQAVQAGETASVSAVVTTGAGEGTAAEVTLTAKEGVIEIAAKLGRVGFGKPPRRLREEADRLGAQAWLLTTWTDVVVGVLAVADAVRALIEGWIAGPLGEELATAAQPTMWPGDPGERWTWTAYGLSDDEDDEEDDGQGPLFREPPPLRPDVPLTPTVTLDHDADARAEMAAALAWDDETPEED